MEIELFKLDKDTGMDCSMCQRDINVGDEYARVAVVIRDTHGWKHIRICKGCGIMIAAFLMGGKEPSDVRDLRGP